MIAIVEIWAYFLALSFVIMVCKMLTQLVANAFTYGEI